MIDTKELLLTFLDEKVMVVTKMEMLIQAEDDEEIQVTPKVFYGELLGVDNLFIYLGDQKIPFIILPIDQIRMIERDPNGFTDQDLLSANSDDTIN